MPPRLRPCAVLVASLLLATGCGGDSERKNQYVSAVNAAYSRLARTFTDLQTQITKESSPGQDSRAMSQYFAAADRAVRALQAVKPPGKLAPLHKQLVGEIAAYRQQFEQARRRFRSSNTRVVLRARTDLTTATTRISDDINTTIAKINSALSG